MAFALGAAGFGPDVAEMTVGAFLNEAFKKMQASGGNVIELTIPLKAPLLVMTLTVRVSRLQPTPSDASSH